jgi:leader peptidase (prepilin peptidase)/N-methyltransferase
MLAVLIGACAVLGLAVGSFLNVVIYRVPNGESVVTPRSSCPTCGAQIRERDNIPVVSWFVLKGRCRDCQAPISIRYPSVELGCCALFAGCAARFGYRWDLPAYLVLFAGLLALSCIDVERMILPKKIVYPMTVLVAVLLLVAAAETGKWHAFLVGIACAVGWFIVFLGLYLASPKLLGLGDVRLSLVLGLALGWLGVGYVLLGFFSANLVGAVVGMILIARNRAQRGSRVPYGVFLAVGCAIAVFAGPTLLRPFTHSSL